MLNIYKENRGVSKAIRSVDLIISPVARRTDKPAAENETDLSLNLERHPQPQSWPAVYVLGEKVEQIVAIETDQAC